MKRILAEIGLEFLSWLVLISGTIVILFQRIIKAIVYVWKEKETIKRHIRESAVREIERLNELEELEKAIPEYDGGAPRRKNTDYNEY